MGAWNSKETRTFQIRKDEAHFPIEILPIVIKNLTPSADVKIPAETQAEPDQIELIPLVQEERKIGLLKFRTQETLRSGSEQIFPDDVLKFVRDAEKALIDCYRSNPSKLMDCQREIKHFKSTANEVLSGHASRLEA